jgi:hypothetical protein
VGNVLAYLDVPITEINFLGRGITLTLEPNLRRDIFELGESFSEPRLFGSRIAVRESAALIFGRDSHKLEGTEGYVEVQRPLYTLDQQWGFDTFVVWNSRQQRNFRGNEIWQLNYPTDEAPARQVPFIYDTREIQVNALVTRRFDLAAYKLDVTSGLGGYSLRYDYPTDAPPLSKAENDWYIDNWLPRSEDATYLYGLLSFFKPEYAVEHDLESFALSEDLHLGPQLKVGFKWAIPTFVKNSFGEIGGSLRWVFRIGGDVLSIAAAGRMRFISGDEPVGHFYAKDGPVNQHYAVQVTNWSPLFEGGRFVTRVLASWRIRDLNHRQVLLGGGTGLRGLGAEALVGHNLLLGNFEYRTRPFSIATVHVGFVLFYDVGSAYGDNPENGNLPQLVHTMGLGMRVLFPQLNQQVIRLDIGYVIGGPQSLSPDRVSSSFGQITQLPEDFFDDPI